MSAFWAVIHVSCIQYVIKPCRINSVIWSNRISKKCYFSILSISCCFKFSKGRELIISIRFVISGYGPEISIRGKAKIVIKGDVVKHQHC